MAKKQRRRPYAITASTMAARHAAKTHCARGHEYTPDNTLWVESKTSRSGEARRCIACEKARRLERSAKYAAGQVIRLVIVAAGRAIAADFSKASRAELRQAFADYTRSNDQRPPAGGDFSRRAATIVAPGKRASTAATR